MNLYVSINSIEMQKKQNSEGREKCVIYINRGKFEQNVLINSQKISD